MKTQITLTIETADAVTLYSEEGNYEPTEENIHTHPEEVERLAHRGIVNSVKDYLKEFCADIDEHCLYKDDSYFYDIAYEDGQEVNDYVAVKATLSSSNETVETTTGRPDQPDEETILELRRNKPEGEE